MRSSYSTSREYIQQLDSIKRYYDAKKSHPSANLNESVQNELRHYSTLKHPPKQNFYEQGKCYDINDKRKSLTSTQNWRDNLRGTRHWAKDTYTPTLAVTHICEWVCAYMYVKEVSNAAKCHSPRSSKQGDQLEDKNKQTKVSRKRFYSLLQE